MNVVAYFRVSTDKQKRSGLGLEAQQEAVERYLRHNPSDVVGTYTEVESGKNCVRPELAKAIAHAKEAGAKLVVAKLDRLSRNVAFIAALMESSLDFVCCDMPSANRLTLHILAAVAEHEARCISERTTVALAAAKRRGVKLGGSNPKCRNLSPRARLCGSRRAAVLRSTEAARKAKVLRPQVEKLLAEKLTYRQMADRLNHGGWKTCRGAAKWSAKTAWNLCRRLSISSS